MKRVIQSAFFGLILLLSGMVLVLHLWGEPLPFVVGSPSSDSVGERTAPAMARSASARPGATVAVADGVVVPIRSTQLRFTVTGAVAEVLVAEGERVAAGAPLLRLENAHQQANVAAAQAQLARAQSQLSALQSGARAEEIAVANARVDTAAARVDFLYEDSSPATIAAAEANVAAAQAALQQLFAGPRADERIAVEAELRDAEAALRQAQSAYNAVSWMSDIAMRPESLALEQATNVYDAAKARYDDLFAGANADQLAAARARVQEAEAELLALQEPPSPARIAEAEAQLERRRAELDLLRAGERDEARTAAAADVIEAEALLAQAQAALAQTTLTAPFAGTVAQLLVQAGETVNNENVVVHFADFSRWQVQTSDLGEMDIALIERGNRAVVTIDALDGAVMQGEVASVSARGESRDGDVLYTALIAIEQPDPLLRWQMTAEVRIEHGAR